MLRYMAGMTNLISFVLFYFFIDLASIFLVTTNISKIE